MKFDIKLEKPYLHWIASVVIIQASNLVCLHDLVNTKSHAMLFDDLFWFIRKYKNRKSFRFQVKKKKTGTTTNFPVTLTTLIEITSFSLSLVVS